MTTGWMMGFEGWTWMVGWAVILVVVVWLLVREPRGRDERHHSGDTAVETLRGRLARGEIGPEEFERTLALIEAHPVHTTQKGTNDRVETH